MSSSPTFHQTTPTKPQHWVPHPVTGDTSSPWSIAQGWGWVICAFASHTAPPSRGQRSCWKVDLTQWEGNPGHLIAKGSEVAHTEINVLSKHCENNTEYIWVWDFLPAGANGVYPQKKLKIAAHRLTCLCADPPKIFWGSGTLWWWQPMAWDKNFNEKKYD